MKIAIIGTGYVGLCTGLGFALLGHDVICADKDEEKVNALARGRPSLYEPGVEEGLKKVAGRLQATTDTLQAVENSDVAFITVGTPQSEDGTADLTAVKQAAEDIGIALRVKSSYTLVVVKSTVPPGTTEQTVTQIIKNISRKRPGKDFGVCVNPEFLREGSALRDFLKPDRIVIGSADKKAGDTLEQLYDGVDALVLRTDLKTAEMIKYASNAFLAARVSLINEIGNICKGLGVDANDVALGIGLDKRIGKEFLSAGVGFGGSCFSKDVAALIAHAGEIDENPKMLTATLAVNRAQPLRIVQLLAEKTDVKNKKIAVLGLAFKPGTDDIRDAPSLRVIDALLRLGAKVHAYDPKAMPNMRKRFGNIVYAPSVADALKGADACLILTEWPEFAQLADEDFSAMKKKVIIEGRRVLSTVLVSNFEGVCW